MFHYFDQLFQTQMQTDGPRINYDNTGASRPCVVIRHAREDYIQRGFTITKIDFNSFRKQESQDQLQEEIFLSDSQIAYQKPPIIVLQRVIKRKIRKQGVLGQVDLFQKPQQVQVPQDVKQENNDEIFNCKLEEFKRGPYRVYTNEQKQNAIDLISFGHSYKQVSNSQDIPMKNLRRWVTTGGIRKKGGGRKQMDANMERKLYRWIIEEIKLTGKKVSRSQIRQQALEFSEFQGKFKASKGWTDKFVRKYNLKRAAMKDRIYGSVKSESSSHKDDMDDDIEVVLQEFQSDHRVCRKSSGINKISHELLSRIHVDVKSLQQKINDSPIINFENFFKP